MTKAEKFNLIASVASVLGLAFYLWDKFIEPIFNSANMDLGKYYSHLDYTAPAGVIILVIVMIFALRRIRFLENYCKGLHIETKKFINDNNEVIKAIVIQDLSTVFAQYAKNDKEFDRRTTDLDNRFNSLNTDMASFTLFYQGLLAMASNDIRGAYVNFILSMEYSISGDNLRNIPIALKNIKDQILPFLSKSDIEAIKKEKTVDIEVLLIDITKVDKDKMLVPTIEEIRAVIHRLPETKELPTIRDVIPEKTFVDVQTEKGKLKINLIGIKEALLS